jgi:hypothetical protein
LASAANFCQGSMILITSRAPSGEPPPCITAEDLAGIHGSVKVGGSDRFPRLAHRGCEHPNCY